MSKTIFDIFLEEQLRDPEFAERFKRAGEAWDVALQIAALREKAGLSKRPSPQTQDLPAADQPARIALLRGSFPKTPSLTIMTRLWMAEGHAGSILTWQVSLMRRCY